MRPVALLALVSAALLAGLACPAGLSAGLFCPCGRPNPCVACPPCGQCQAHPCHCVTTPQVTAVPQTQTVPVTTWRDVTTTQYRTQAEVQTVPVTQYRTVTVDEGSWQQVWVPRLVAKQVPEITYQQQTVYRQVPYQVTQRIPEVRYQMMAQMVPAVVPGTVAACPACGPGLAWSSPVVAAPPMITTPVIAAQPVPLTVQTVQPAPAVSALQPVWPQAAAAPGRSEPGREAAPLRSVFADASATAGGISPAPDPMFAGGGNNASEWTPVRTASPEPAVPEPRDLPPARISSSASGLFTPAPSASAVWRSRTGSMWR